MKRIEEFTQNEKSFISFNLSGFKTDDEYKDFIETFASRTKLYRRK